LTATEVRSTRCSALRLRGPWAKSKGSGRGVELPPNKNEKLSLFALRTGRFCDIVVQGGVSDKTGSSMNNNLIG